MKNGYAFTGLKENMARALFKDIDISHKTAIEMSNFLRGRTTDEAKDILKRVLNKTQAVPFKRFTNGLGHRAGANIASGRFPQKASKAFTELIELVEANAQSKGLSSNLKIVHLAAQKGTNQFHPGRQRRRMFKRTHLEIVVEEIESKKEKPKAEKKQKSETKKAETKPEVKETKKEEAAPKQEKKETPKTEAHKESPKKTEDKPVEEKKND